MVITSHKARCDALTLGILLDQVFHLIIDTVYIDVKFIETALTVYNIPALVDGRYPSCLE